MKKIFLFIMLTAFASSLLVSCKKADEVVRHEGNELADIYGTLEGLGSQRLFEPRFSNDTIYFDVPYFYPEDSDNEVDLKKIILRSTIPADASLSPALGVIRDMTNPFEFSITSGAGEKKSFVVVTKKVGNVNVNKATIKFVADGSNQEVEAIVRDTDVIFYVLPGTDISSVALDLEINKHSTSSIATGSSINLTQDVPLTITGIDGRTKRYTLKAQEPIKLDYGVGINRRLWLKNGADLGFTTNMETSIAVSGDHLVVVTRTNPAKYRVFNRFTGAYVKDLPLPFSALSMQVTHDASGTLLGATYAGKGGRFLVYKWANGVDAAPELLIDWVNNNPTGITLDGGVGRRINIYGDLKGDAVIMSPAGQSTIIYKWRVAGGQLVSNTPEVIDYKSLVGGATTKMGYQADAQPISTAANTNYFINYQFEIGLVNGVSHERITGFADQTAVFGVFHFATDYIEFNNAKYLAIQKLTNWTFTNAIMGLYDVTETSKIPLSASDPRYNTFNVYNSEGFTASANASGTGDICFALSPDKERLQVYMLLTNGGIMAHEFTKYAP